MTSTARAHLAAVVTQIVGYLVAFIPSFSADRQALIVAGTIIGSVTVLIAHAIRSRPATLTPSAAAEAELRTLLAGVDFSTIVRGELAHLVSATPARFDTATGQPVRGHA
jgi:hypothetical protein